MNAVAKTRLSVEDYLAIENASPFKSEFYEGEMFAMAGASPTHNFVKDNLIRALGNRLDSGPCRTASSDQRIRIERTGLFTYPDIVIVCGKPKVSPRDPLAIVNPTAIVEILSPTTEQYDRGTKFKRYRQIPGLREYILVAQDEAVVERYFLQSNGSWNLTAIEGVGESLEFASLGITIPLAEVYRDIEFPDPAEANTMN